MIVGVLVPRRLDDQLSTLARGDHLTLKLFRVPLSRHLSQLNIPRKQKRKYQDRLN